LEQVKDKSKEAIKRNNNNFFILPPFLKIIHNTVGQSFSARGGSRQKAGSFAYFLLG
jgi:hypothetical protein